eukprot:1122626-Prorocentrum_minimum.AAC.1
MPFGIVIIPMRIDPTAQVRRGGGARAGFPGTAGGGAAGAGGPAGGGGAASGARPRPPRAGRRIHGGGGRSDGVQRAARGQRGGAGAYAVLAGVAVRGGVRGDYRPVRFATLRLGWRGWPRRGDYR